MNKLNCSKERMGPMTPWERWAFAHPVASVYLVMGAVAVMAVCVLVLAKVGPA